MATVTLVIIATVAVPVAMADAYWNVWSGNLPDSSGTRSEYTPYTGDQEWTIRMSWTSASHYMHWLFIGNNGDWYADSTDVLGAYYEPGGGPYDLILNYSSGWVNGGVAQAGCQNPSGLATVWVNCRNAVAGSG